MKKLLPKEHYPHKIAAEKNYLQSLETYHALLSDTNTLKKSQELTRARYDVERFEIANKIVTVKDYINNLEYHYNNIFLPQYELELKECEKKWDDFNKLITPMMIQPNVAKVFDEWNDEELQNIEVKNMIFKQLRHLVKI